MSKTLFSTFMVSLMISFSAAAVDGNELVKNCNAQMEFDGQKISLSLSVYSDGDGFRGETSTMVDSVTTSRLHYDEVQVSDHSVRAGLTADLGEELDQQNLGERLISHAMAMTSGELGAMTSGMDLTKVRSVTVYHFVEPGTNIGMTALVEARDDSGNEMGSFYGGFLVGACEAGIAGQPSLQN